MCEDAGIKREFSSFLFPCIPPFLSFPNAPKGSHPSIPFPVGQNFSQHHLSLSSPSPSNLGEGGETPDEKSLSPPLRPVFGRSVGSSRVGVRASSSAGHFVLPLPTGPFFHPPFHHGRRNKTLVSDPHPRKKLCARIWTRKIVNGRMRPRTLRNISYTYI